MTLATGSSTGKIGQPDRSLAIQVQRLHAGARLPERQTALASGFDLHARLDAPIEVGTMPVRVPCGIAIAAPTEADVQIRPRSGLSARGIIAILGTIDADYRGELMVTMYCLPDAAPFVVEDGDRIAQLVVSRLVPVTWDEAAALDGTERGAGGHGSTGVA